MGDVLGFDFPGLLPRGRGCGLVLGGELRAELLELRLHCVLLALHELGHERLPMGAILRDRRGGRLGGSRGSGDGGRRRQRVTRSGMLREGAWQGGN